MARSLGGVALGSMASSEGEISRKQIHDTCVKQRDVCQGFLDAEKQAGISRFYTQCNSV